MDLGLKNRVAIVTGGGRGIGRQISLTLAAEGARVAVNDYYLERANAVADEIKKAGGQAIGVQADVTKRVDVEAMVQNILDAWGSVEILVNNAGIPAGMLEAGAMGEVVNLFVNSNEDNWDKWIRLDLFGNFVCDRVVLPHMIARRYGKIVSIVSDAGRIGEYGTAVYSGAKAGIIAFNKALAKEVARNGINVNCVSPSATWGTMIGDLGGGASPQTDQQRQLQQKQMVMYPLAKGLNRLGMPSDLANAVAFMASDAAAWITGQVLSVNGGYCMVD